MVKTTQKSDLPWSAIFSVIVYLEDKKVKYFKLCYQRDNYDLQ